MRSSLSSFISTTTKYTSDLQSSVFVDKFQRYFPQASTNIAKDNFEGDFLLLTYRQPTDDSKLASSFVNAWNGLGQTQFEIESFPLPIADPDVLKNQSALGNFMRSDHVALWYYNVPAIFISDSGLFDMLYWYTFSFSAFSQSRLKINWSESCKAFSCSY